MIITLRELRQIIRKELIKEAAISPKAAAGNGIAMFSYEDKLGCAVYVLYRATGDHSIAKLTLNESTDSLVTSAYWAVIAAIKIVKGEGREPSYVEDVMSKISGYGPLLYDVALKYHSPLQDRSEFDDASVSQEAKNVWKFYAEKRKGDTTYSPETRQLSLKSASSVNDKDLIEAHDEIYETICEDVRAQELKAKNKLQDRSGFMNDLEEALRYVASDYLRNLHMQSSGPEEEDTARCSACGGQGEAPDGETCNACDGSGEVCGKCGGDGELQNGKKCDKCDGSGQKR